MSYVGRQIPTGRMDRSVKEDVWGKDPLLERRYSITAVITAGGVSKRFGSEDKQLAELGGWPLAAWPVYRLVKHPYVERVILATTRKRFEVIVRELSRVLEGRLVDKIVFVESGPHRYETVRQGMLETCTDYVLIQDGARPFITDDMIKLTVEAVFNGYHASYVGRKPVDTVRTSSEYNPKTIDRGSLVLVQTPQVVNRNDWLSAYLRVDLHKITDDIQMVEELYKIGRNTFRVKPVILPESRYNIKITYPEDLMIAEMFIYMRQVDGGLMDYVKL